MTPRARARAHAHAHVHNTHTHTHNNNTRARHQQELVQQAAWQSALARARGDKVLDDPKLLRRSVKREKKSKERSARKWAERNKAQEDERAAKQTKCVLRVFVCVCVVCF